MSSDVAEGSEFDDAIEDEPMPSVGVILAIIGSLISVGLASAPVAINLAALLSGSIGDIDPYAAFGVLTVVLIGQGFVFGGGVAYKTEKLKEGES